MAGLALGSVAGRIAAAGRWLSRHPLLCLTLLLLAQVLPSLAVKDVWLPDEVRHAAVFRNLWERGHWLVLYLGDSAYGDKPPVYFWLLAGIAAAVSLTGGDPVGPAVFMVAAAVSAWAVLAALVQAGQRMGFGPRKVLGAGLILLTCWFFIERAHQPRMDLLFAAYILMAQTALYRATQGAQLQRGPMLWAGLFMGLAALTKGPLGVALPLAGFALFLLRQRRGRLLVSGRAGLALAVVLTIALAYLAGVLATEGPGFIRAVAVEQIWQRAVQPVDQVAPVYAYVPMLAAALLPWSFVLAWAIWRGLRRLGLAGLWAPSTGPDLAQPYLWSSVLGGLTVISALDYKIAFLLVPLLAPLALILSHEIGSAPPPQRRRLFTTIAGFVAVAAVAVPFAPRLTLWPEYVTGVWPVATGLAVTAGLGWAVRGASLQRFGLLVAVGVTVVLVPLYQTTMQGLNAVMSPRALALVIADHAARGYEVAEYDPAYTGHFDYHTGLRLQSLRRPDQLAGFAAQTGCGVVVMRRRVQGDWPDPPALTILAEAQLDAGVYRVLAFGHEGCR